MHPQPIDPLTSKLFNERFDQLIDRLWTIQDRISELKEFENQWGELFERLKARTGRDEPIRILNRNAYRSFHWDRYHILSSDLLSLHQNELDDRSNGTILRQTMHHLRLKPLENFINPDYRITFIDNPRLLLSDEEKQKRTEELRISRAEDSVTFHKQALRRLFPKIKDNYEITAVDVNHLMKRVKSLAKKISGIRHYFNHKYEEDAISKYKRAVEGLELRKLERVTSSLFRIASDVGLILKDFSYAPSSFSYSTAVADQIDIILFGSIAGALKTYYKGCSKKDSYWVAREKFFSSNAVLEIVAIHQPISQPVST